MNGRALTRAARLAVVLLVPLVAATATGEPPEPTSFSLPDPLRLASLPLAPAEGDAVEAGTWRVRFESAYFNLWYGSWHPATIHKEFGLEGQPLQPWELRLLEQRHPDDDIFQVDVEGWMSEATIARGLGRGLTLTATVPWVEVGRPHWDAISQDLHRALGWKTGDRDTFPHSGTLIYVWNAERQRAIEGWDDLVGSHLADVRLALSGPLGRFAGGVHRWVVAVEAPTGRRAGVSGSGGWDAGARWFGRWQGRRTALRLGAGWTRLDRSGSLLGAERDDTWHALAEGAVALGERTAFQLTCRVDSSPLASFTGGLPADPALVFGLALRRRLGGGGWWAVALGENLPPHGVAPDFTLHFQVGR